EAVPGSPCLAARDRFRRLVSRERRCRGCAPTIWRLHGERQHSPGRPAVMSRTRRAPSPGTGQAARSARLSSALDQTKLTVATETSMWPPGSREQMRRAVRAANFARSVTHRLSTPPGKTVRHVVDDIATPFTPIGVPQPARQHLVSEELFQGVVLRERRRAERSDEPFLLYFIEPDPGMAPRSALLWRSTLDALAVSTRETDVVGWFKQHEVIGVIITGLDSRAHVAREFDARLRRELARRLHQSTIDRLSIRMHVYPET